jgi:hypothetical protein
MLRDRQTLVSLACVSQAFSSPALDVLWAALHDFSPLARLFPETIVCLVKNESDAFEHEETWYDTIGDYKVWHRRSVRVMHHTLKGYESFRHMYPKSNPNFNS